MNKINGKETPLHGTDTMDSCVHLCMKRMSISLGDEVVDRLKEIASSSGCSIANVIRMLLWERLEEIYGKGGQGEAGKASEGRKEL